MRWINLLALALPLLAGCGSGMQAVEGTVSYDNGTPYTDGGLVVFEKTEAGTTVMARGEIQPDGHFTLSTNKPGDGVPPGKYRAMVTPMSDLMPPTGPPTGTTIDRKYSQFATSELSFEVKAGKNNFPITVGKPVKKPPVEPRQ